MISYVQEFWTCLGNIARPCFKTKNNISKKKLEKCPNLYRARVCVCVDGDPPSQHGPRYCLSDRVGVLGKG
jgi:hypothetical protein